MGFNHSDNIVNFLLNEESTKRIPALYHISFKDNLEGEWKPRPPDGFQIKAKEKNKEKEVNITEPKTPRISCSTDLKKCFYAIYPNISFFFETKKFPIPSSAIDISVYKASYITLHRIFFAFACSIALFIISVNAYIQISFALVDNFSMTGQMSDL